jgi:hypothetical protein
MDWEDLFEREDRDGVHLPESGTEGNETTGQIAAVLLLVANLPVALSILVRFTNRCLPLPAGVKTALADFNRWQKRYLMRFHYYLNPAIFGVVIWHYMSARCLSTPLPEWGLVLMVGFVVGGMLIKFRWGPRTLRKRVFQLHTQPMVFIAMVLVLTAGHLVID